MKIQLCRFPGQNCSHGIPGQGMNRLDRQSSGQTELRTDRLQDRQSSRQTELRTDRDQDRQSSGQTDIRTDVHMQDRTRAWRKPLHGRSLLLGEGSSSTFLFILQDLLLLPCSPKADPSLCSVLGLQWVCFSWRTWGQERDQVVPGYQP